MTPDIALCCDNVKKDCPLAPRCYRATAAPDDVRQSYFTPAGPGNDCRDFISNDKGLPYKTLSSPRLRGKSNEGERTW